MAKKKQMEVTPVETAMLLTGNEPADRDWSYLDKVNGVAYGRVLVDRLTRSGVNSVYMLLNEADAGDMREVVHAPRTGFGNVRFTIITDSSGDDSGDLLIKWCSRIDRSIKEVVVMIGGAYPVYDIEGPMRAWRTSRCDVMAVMQPVSVTGRSYSVFTDGSISPNVIHGIDGIAECEHAGLLFIRTGALLGIKRKYGDLIGYMFNELLETADVRAHVLTDNRSALWMSNSAGQVLDRLTSDGRD